MWIKDISASTMGRLRFPAASGCSFDAVFFLEILSDAKSDAIFIAKPDANAILN